MLQEGLWIVLTVALVIVGAGFAWISLRTWLHIRRDLPKDDEQ